MNMKKIIIGLIACLIVHAQYAGGNIGFSILYRPPLFLCPIPSWPQQNLGPCYNDKMSFSPTKSIPNASTDGHQVGRMTVQNSQHFIGYWAPVKPDIYIFGPLYRETGIYNNIYTALDIIMISVYGYNSPIINWVHSQDPNINVYDNRKDASNGGWAYLGWQHYINVDKDKHDRTYPLFKPISNNITELTYSKFKSPVGTIEEYFDGVSVGGARVLIYWPLHMIDPLQPPYPSNTEIDGFTLPKIRKMITNYSSQYKKRGIGF